MTYDDFLLFQETTAWKFSAKDFNNKLATYEATIYSKNIYNTLKNHLPGDDITKTRKHRVPCMHFVAVLKSIDSTLRNVLINELLHVTSFFAPENLLSNDVVMQDYDSAVMEHQHGQYVNYTYTYCRVFNDDGKNKAFYPQGEVTLKDRHWIKFGHKEYHSSYCSTPCIFYPVNTNQRNEEIENLPNFIPPPSI